VVRGALTALNPPLVECPLATKMVCRRSSTTGISVRTSLKTVLLIGRSTSLTMRSSPCACTFALSLRINGRKCGGFTTRMTSYTKCIVSAFTIVPLKTYITQYFWLKLLTRALCLVSSAVFSGCLWNYAAYTPARLPVKLNVRNKDIADESKFHANDGLRR